MNHRENYKIANPETDYFVPRKLQNCENKKKRNLPAEPGRAWPSWGCLMITIMFACFVV